MEVIIKLNLKIRQDRLIKTLSTSTSALNASNIKQKETISSSKEEKIRSDLERNKLNQSKIEDLIMVINIVEKKKQI